MYIEKIFRWKLFSSLIKKICIFLFLFIYLFIFWVYQCIWQSFVQSTSALQIFNKLFNIINVDSPSSCRFVTLSNFEYRYISLTRASDLPDLFLMTSINSSWQTHKLHFPKLTVVILFLYLIHNVLIHTLSL